MKDDFCGLTKSFTKLDLKNSDKYNIIEEKIVDNKTIIKAKYTKSSDDFNNLIIVFDNKNKIESVETVIENIEPNKLKEELKILQHKLNIDYGSCETTSDYTKKTDIEIFDAVKSGDLFCLWNGNNTQNLQNGIKYILLKVELKNDAYAFIIECEFSKPEIYAVKKSNNTDSPRTEIKTKKKNVNSNNREYKLYFYFFGFLFIVIWFLFLLDPICRMFKDFFTDFSIKSFLINIIYYVVYFCYTVCSCLIPLKISKDFLKFKNNENFDKNYLLDDSIKLTPETHTIWKAYKSTFFDKNFGIKNKTRASADLYFNYESVICTMNRLPIISWFKLISSSFMGLGILGTFIGFSTGLSSIDFNTESTTKMISGVEALVKNGLATAFNTSIVGMLLSLIYNFLVFNPLIKKIKGYFEHLSDELDKEFYVSETEALMQYTMVTGENSENITFSQSLKFIVENINKQTDALNNFNNTLADRITNMKQSVDTAMERIATDVGGELKNVVIGNVQKEMGSLKSSLIEAAKEFSIAAKMLTNTPDMLEKANNELKTYLEDTRTSFSEMLAENEKTNKTILDEVVITVREQLSEQFNKFSNSLIKALDSAQKVSETLADTPEKIDLIENTLIKKESEVASKLDNTSNKLAEIASNVKDYFATMHTGIGSVLQDLSNAEKNIKELLVSAKMHEDNSGKNLTSVIDETNRMLDGFKAVDINLKNIFESIGNEIVKYNTTVESTLDQYLESFEKGSKSFSISVTSSMQDFESAIDSLNTNMIDVQRTSNQFAKSIDNLSQILNHNNDDTEKDKQ